MKNQRTYTVWQLANYLRVLRYHLTYRKGNWDAYYNPRNRQIILLPIVREILLTGQDIRQLFKESKATDMPAELEYIRFTQFIHLMYDQ